MLAAVAGVLSRRPRRKVCGIVNKVLVTQYTQKRELMLFRDIHVQFMKHFPESPSVAQKYLVSDSWQRL